MIKARASSLAALISCDNIDNKSRDISWYQKQSANLDFHLRFFVLLCLHSMASHTRNYEGTKQSAYKRFYKNFYAFVSLSDFVCAAAHTRFNYSGISTCIHLYVDERAVAFYKNSRSFRSRLEKKADDLIDGA